MIEDQKDSDICWNIVRLTMLHVKRVLAPCPCSYVTIKNPRGSRGFFVGYLLEAGFTLAQGFL